MATRTGFRATYGAGDWQVPRAEHVPFEQNPSQSESAEHGFGTQVRTAAVEHTRFTLLQAASDVHNGGPQTPDSTLQ